MNQITRFDSFLAQEFASRLCSQKDTLVHPVSNTVALTDILLKFEREIINLTALFHLMPILRLHVAPSLIPLGCCTGLVTEKFHIK